jgi:hypothetical protein
LEAEMAKQRTGSDSVMARGRGSATRERLSLPIFTFLLVIAAATQSCSGYDCVEHSCAEYEGNTSPAGTMVSICQRSQGDCGEGCMGWRVLDTNGEKLSDCADSEPGNCRSFMEGDAREYCALGQTVGCGRGGTACSTSGDCCAGLVCTFNICG